MRSLRKSATSGRLRLFFLGGNLPGRRADFPPVLESDHTIAVVQGLSAQHRACRVSQAASRILVVSLKPSVPTFVPTRRAMRRFGEAKRACRAVHVPPQIAPGIDDTYSGLAPKSYSLTVKRR